ncbi:putative glycosyltransferase EpsE [Rubripirellula amarantea]|uniref:Putative glycosyltransferase EpsE n=1 Tax=Rubripirellula amarantea TaxID=2527999 RepID=A0A5C5WXQ7_9BACT|nr:glycosyltransferase family A protein [Rubripirellula amarantea]TWT54911.1 putative glycosyltransferase EpsE [Rubripirellula amarantea]
MTKIACPFRQDVRYDNSRETAHCELAARVLGIGVRNNASDDGVILNATRVDRSACEYCVGDGKVNPERIGEVIASLTLGAKQTDKNAHACDVSQDDYLREIASSVIQRASRRTISVGSGLAACDAVLVIEDSDSPDAIQRSVRSWLDQEQAFPLLHLVAASKPSDDAIVRFADEPSVRLHRHSTVGASSLFRRQRSWTGRTFAAIQCIVGKLETPYIAIASTSVVAQSLHIARAFELMNQRGAEIYAGSLNVSGHYVDSSLPDPTSPTRSIHPATLVLRRASFVDMGGIAERDHDVDVEWVCRAVAEQRKFAIGKQVAGTLDMQRGTHQDVNKASVPPVADHNVICNDVPRYELSGSILESNAIGFPDATVGCDVVLPFRGHLDYVDEAIQSVLSQHAAKFTLHLIDDATEMPESELVNWLSHYASDDRVRIYRNRENIGQFASFNRVVPHLEHDWIVTQDGDDRSLPDRLRHSLKRATLTQCDMFAGATELFGSTELTEYGSKSSNQSSTTLMRYSRYPAADESWYFVENPTIVHRRAFFCRMNGFADFGTVLRSRTSVDSEYMLRAYFSGASISVTKRPMIEYRVHDQSATQHGHTRMGSPTRVWCQQELRRRLNLMKSGGFDPRIFGSLSRCEPAERWEAKP